jgi:hypothetical protein
MVSILDLFKKKEMVGDKNKSEVNDFIVIDSPVLHTYEYKRFSEKISSANYPKDKKTGYTIVPKELLAEQGKLLLGYIRDRGKQGKHHSDIDPKLLFDAAFKIVTPEGYNCLRVAQNNSDWKTTEELIKAATAEQLFLQAEDGTTALHSAVRMKKTKDALAIIRKEGVTPEQLRLKDNAGETASYYAVEALKKNSDRDGHIDSNETLKLVINTDMKKILKEIGGIAGNEELQWYYHPAATEVFKELSEEHDREKVLSTLTVFKGEKDEQTRNLASVGSGGARPNLEVILGGRQAVMPKKLGEKSPEIE